MRTSLVIILLSCFSLTAWAQDAVAPPDVSTENAPGTSPQQSPQHPVAKVYSPGYETRLKIHKYASFATLPLFATELWLGQSLYNNPPGDESRRGAHIAVGSGIIGLFGVNTVTGGWNLWESRKDPQGRKLRMLHSILMMTSDAGFAATAMTGPHTSRRGLPILSVNKSTHRDLAIGSIGIGSIGYLIMLFGGR